MTADQTCTATITTYSGDTYRCAEPAGHYNGDTSWHQNQRHADDACQMRWSDEAGGATPHRPSTPENPLRAPQDAPQPQIGTPGGPERASGSHAGVQGRCPACGHTALMLGAGGYVTCRRLDCPEPDAASTLLEQRPDACDCDSSFPDPCPGRADRPPGPHLGDIEAAERYSRMLRQVPSDEVGAYIRECLQSDDPPVRRVPVSLCGCGQPETLARVQTSDGHTYLGPPTPARTAEITPACPGVETTPSTCTCLCEGCRYHCAAHHEPDDTDATEGEFDRMMTEGTDVADALDLRQAIAAALEECRVLIPEAQADAVMAVVQPHLDRAEAALARVRNLAGQWQAAMRPGERHPAARALLAALDDQPTGEETPAPEPAAEWRRRVYERPVARAHALAEEWADDTTPITRAEAARLLAERLDPRGWTETDRPA